jgi:hypothetical protein
MIRNPPNRELKIFKKFLKILAAKGLHHPPRMVFINTFPKAAHFCGKPLSQQIRAECGANPQR